MPFAAALSEHPLATHAVGEVVGQILDELGGEPDVAVVFVTPPFAGALEDIAAAIRATLRPGALIGCSAAGVFGGSRGVEGTAAISLLALRGCPATAIALTGAERDVAPAGSTLVVLADPFSFPVDDFLDRATSDTPDLTVVGGLASAAAAAGGNRLVADGAVQSSGAVALVFGPTVAVRPLVSQGCEPVGEPLVVTDAVGTMIREIASQPALDRLMGQVEAASPTDRSRMARSLHVGLVVDERKAAFEAGDFLVRPVLGADHQTRAVAVGAEVQVGSTVQFQVRDAASADAELRELLVDAGGRAALAFTCVGRGRQFFGDSHHDAAVLAEHVECPAVAGMFSAGEIGPVGPQHHVHAMSLSALLFEG